MNIRAVLANKFEPLCSPGDGCVSTFVAPQSAVYYLSLLSLLI